MNWFCAQIGAREHYAVGRALRQQGKLAALYTEFWAGPLTRALGSSKMGDGRWKIGALRSLASRWHRDLEDGRWKMEDGLNGKKHGPRITDHGPQTTVVCSWNLRSLWWEYRRRKISSAQTPYHGFIEVGEQFAACVREELKRQNLSRTDAIFYAYDTGALEAFEWCREQGVKCVLNQMDPNRVEVELVQAEEKKWPGWALQPARVPEEYFVRREREWALADRVVVNSEFSRRALIQQGVPAEKLVVIPLSFEKRVEDCRSKMGDRSLEMRRRPSSISHIPTSETPSSIFHLPSPKTLRVLFLGQVILRKGIQYLMAAAKLLEKENIQFDVVGPIGISQKAVATAPNNLTFHGRAGRDQTAEWYRQSDVFVLPTLSDGFAITQLEAMAYGLPVVTTPCCGEVVANGVDGFVVPERDPAALAAAFQRYLHEPELLASQSAAALTKSKQFSLDHLAANLMKLEAMLR